MTPSFPDAPRLPVPPAGPARRRTRGRRPACSGEAFGGRAPGSGGDKPPARGRHRGLPCCDDRPSNFPSSVLTHPPHLGGGVYPHSRAPTYHPHRFGSGTPPKIPRSSVGGLRGTRT